MQHDANLEAIEENVDDGPRFFKIVGDDQQGGRFSGTRPKQAANKALTTIIKKANQEGKNTDGEFIFSIRECTTESNNKTYNYVGKRVELDEPFYVNIGNGPNQKTIIYKYNNTVTRIKLPKLIEQKEDSIIPLEPAVIDAIIKETPIIGTNPIENEQKVNNLISIESVPPLPLEATVEIETEKKGMCIIL